MTKQTRVFNNLTVALTNTNWTFVLGANADRVALILSGPIAAGATVLWGLGGPNEGVLMVPQQSGPAELLREHWGNGICGDVYAKASAATNVTLTEITGLK